MDYKSALVDSSRNFIEWVVDSLNNNEEHYKNILDIVFEDTPPYSNRAVRILEIANEKNPQLIAPYIDLLTKKLPDMQHQSVRRGIVRILSFHPLTQNEDLLGLLIECCFKWLQDASIAVSIQVYSMSLLYNAVLQIPELNEELRFAIEEQMPEGSAGFKSRGKKILKALKKQSLQPL